MSEPIRVHGIDGLLRKLRYPTWAARPMANLLDRWRFATERGAKGNIKRGPGGWLWHGGVRRSLTSERDQSAFPHWARAGSNLQAARWGEFGTGLLSEDPESSHKRHWPPASALKPWAKAHGMNAFLVARAIGRRGGIAPRRFLRNAADDSAKRIPGWIAQAGREMERLASEGV